MNNCDQNNQTENFWVFKLLTNFYFFRFLQPLGAADYLALCENFDVIILRDIPRMTLFQKTEARRFITLIDALYDNRVTQMLTLTCRFVCILRHVLLS